MTVVERIQRLVSSGKISAEEGDRLLLANADAPTRVPWWNPFHRFGGGPAALVGLLTAALAVATSRLGVRFDGFLDLHVAPVAPALRTALVDQAVAWCLPAFVFWSYALVFDRRARWIDFLGMTGLSRAALVAVAPFIALLTRGMKLPTPGSTPSPMLAVVALVALTALVAYLTLLYQGFKHATGFHGRRLTLGFAAMALLCEVLSKLALLAFAYASHPTAVR